MGCLQSGSRNAGPEPGTLQGQQLPSPPCRQPAPSSPTGRKKALWGLAGEEERICQCEQASCHV